MKYVLTTLVVGTAFIVGLNIGVTWGLTAKPTLDLAHCKIVTRFEDGSLVCDPGGRELRTEDEGNTDQWVIHNTTPHYQPTSNPQQTVSADELQPVMKEAR